MLVTQLRLTCLFSLPAIMILSSEETSNDDAELRTQLIELKPTIEATCVLSNSATDSTQSKSPRYELRRGFLQSVEVKKVTRYCCF